MECEFRIKELEEKIELIKQDFREWKNYFSLSFNGIKQNKKWGILLVELGKVCLYNWFIGLPEA